MAMLSQIKNFIKGGRSSNSTHSGQSRQSNARKFETAARIVEEENKARKTMPRYNGLEDYEVLSKLGDGAFSKVYEAKILSTGEKVAIKIVRKTDLSHQQKASVLKEAQIMRTLKNHPSIVKLLNFIETKEHYFLILELCPGGEIFHQIVRLTYFSEDLSRHCIRQVAEGIRYLHEEKGVIHRDIKPENLLFMPIDFMERTKPLPPPEFDEPKEDEGEFVLGVGGGGIGQVKIADFGLSKVVWDQQTMTPCGTVGYTAPEIVKDQRYSKSVDMWALGCVLYTFLCGFPPFYDESIKVLTEKVSKGQYTFMSPWWDNISVEVKDLIEHLLCIDPDSRYTIDEFLAHPWVQGMKMTEVEQTDTNAKIISMEDKLIDLTTVPMFTPVESTNASPKPLTDKSNQPETEAEVFKRMVQEQNKDQQELEDAVPREMSPGVSSFINSRTNSQSNSQAPSIIASGATTPRRDLFSGVSSMKEMFDISYTVHRMAEEKVHRKNLKLQQHNAGDVNVNRRSAFMSAINDDTDDDDIMDKESESDMTTDENSSTQTGSDDEVDKELENLKDKLNVVALEQIEKTPKANPGKKLRNNFRQPFELNMDKATLLGRRKHVHEIE
ncbi:Pkinase-domain-containing protein [Backusella circina FSU 941]|nr:Pkinase-domain-containing protein [Backusella circina FSU 941]